MNFTIFNRPNKKTYTLRSIFSKKYNAGNVLAAILAAHLLTLSTANVKYLLQQNSIIKIGVKSSVQSLARQLSLILNLEAILDVYKRQVFSLLVVPVVSWLTPKLPKERCV